MCLSSLFAYSSAMELVKKVKASLKCSQLLVVRMGITKFHKLSKMLDHFLIWDYDRSKKKKKNKSSLRQREKEAEVT